MSTISVSGATSVSSATTSVYDVLNGGTLTVKSGGNIADAVVSAGGAIVMSGGVETSATILTGATVSVVSSSVVSMSDDLVYGTISTTSKGLGVFTSETVENGGTLILQNGNSASGTLVSSGGTFVVTGADLAANNTTLVSGGVLDLSSPKATIGGSLTFLGGDNILAVVSVATSGYGDLAVISGFSSTDEVDVTVLGAGATLTFATSGVNEAVIVAAGANTETLLFSGTSTYTSSTLGVVTSGGKEYVEYSASGFAGGGVVSTTSTGTSTGLNVSSGETLSVAAGGAVVSTTVALGGALVISGGVDSLASVLSGGTETVIAGGSATGDQIYGSLSTVASGSAVLTSETVEAGGSLLLANGDTANNTTVLNGGTLNISGANTAANNIVLSGGGVLDLQSPKATIGGSLTFAGGGNNLEVTGIASAPSTTSGVTTSFGDLAIISGFSTTDKIEVAVVSAGATLSYQTNGDDTETVTINGTSGTTAVSESFIFNSASVYNAFTVISQTDTTAGGGVDIVFNPNATAYTVSSGTVSGLTVSSGETLTVAVGATVSATNVLSGGVFIVSGSDFGATISGAETVVGTASGDKIYGGVIVSGAISGATVYAGGSLTIDASAATGTSDTVLFGGSEILTNGGSTSGDVISGTATLSGAGDIITSATITSSGLVTINIGAIDNGATILAGGNETVYGDANGDNIFGTQLVSYATAVVTSETVYAGGNLDLFLKGGVASATTVLSGGALNVNGYAYASNTVLSGGGMLDLQSPKAEATGSLTFEGGDNVLKIDGVTSAGFGTWAAVISGFSATDQIDITSSAFVGSALSLSQTTSGGNTVATIIDGGTVVESFTFAGTALDNDLSLLGDGNGGAILEITPLPVTTSVTTPTASGAYTVTAPNTLEVDAGGSIIAASIQSGAFLAVKGGTDSGAMILAGANELVAAGAASGDQIYGSALFSGGANSDATVFGGGDLTMTGGNNSNLVLDGGAVLIENGAALSGSLTFANGFNDFVVSGATTADLAVISGFSTSDKIDAAGISPTSASLTFTSNADTTETVTVSGGGVSQSFIFANGATYNAGTMTTMKDSAGGVDLVLKTMPDIAFTSLSGLESNQLAQVVNGTVNVAVDPEAVGTTVSVLEGSTVVGTATVQANGYWTSNVTLLNANGANVLTASDTDGANQTGTTATSLTTNVNTTAAAYIPGNLVISVYGDGSGTGNYTLDQAAPITLDQITTSGTIVSQIVLPETTTLVNGVTENAISGEYGSASEGALQLSADGHSLTIFGYGVNYLAFDASDSNAVYGSAGALGQSISLTSDTAVTLVPRVIADINASGTIDTSTALYNIYDGNNPRSVVTVNGSAFWLSGQGVKGSTNQGVFYATDGASTATALDTATDTREAEIYNGQLYVSADSTQGATNIADYGALPTSTTTPIVLTGLGPTVTLNGANGNAANGSTGTVYLSPQSFFFANATTLYVADSGVPKNGGIGDGGLQKWVDVGGTWTLDYTLTAGLNLQANTATSGVAGLYGLTGEVVNGNVELFASSSTIGELDQSYLYSITDSLASTTGSGESFATVMTAAPDTIIRGVSFAPTAYAPTITGTVAGQTATLETAIAPFSAATIADANSNAVETLTISIGGAGGALTEGANYKGTPTLVSQGAGVYKLTGALASLNAELDDLLFTSSAAGASTFTLSDLSSANSTPTVDSTTTVVDNNVIGGNGSWGGVLSVDANNYALTVQASSHVNVAGAGNTITAGANSNFGVSGDDNTITASGDGIWLNRGIGEIVNGANNWITVAAGVSATVNGASNGIDATAGSATLTLGGNGAWGGVITAYANNDALTLQASSHVNVAGAGNTITAGANSNFGVSGDDNTITASGDGIWLNRGIGEIVNGANNWTTVAAGVSATVNGASNGIDATAGAATLTLGGNGAWGGVITAYANNDALTLQASSHVNVAGAGNTITAGANSNFGVGGDNNTITATSNGIWLNGGTGEIVNGASNWIVAAAGVGATVNGASNGIDATAGAATLTLGGNGAWGGVITAYANNDALTLQASSHVNVAGAGNTITAGANSNFGVSGNGNAISLAAGDAVWLNGGTGNYLNLGVNTGAETIVGFGQDTSGVVDLLNNVGGFASAQDAYGALQSDGHGGSLLSLGANGSLDFAGVSKTQMSAASFKIG